MSLSAVIVAYNPDTNFTHNVSVIAKNCSDVVIVDNSNDKAAQLIGERLNVTVLQQTENIGVAAALNVGLQFLYEKGYKTALLFDQDSCPFPHFFEEMSYVAENTPPRVATIGAVYGITNPDSVKQDSKRYLPIKTVITSGSLVFLDAWNDIGKFREDLFIDHVDHEFCLRARKNGYEVLLAPHAYLDHSVGFPQKHVFLGKTVQSSHHAAFRYYYLFRNYLLMLPSLFLYHPKWFARMGLSLLPKMLIKAVLFEPDRWTKICFAYKGILHGIQRKSGRLG